MSTPWKMSLAFAPSQSSEAFHSYSTGLADVAGFTTFSIAICSPPPRLANSLVFLLDESGMIVNIYQGTVKPAAVPA